MRTTLNETIYTLYMHPQGWEEMKLSFFLKYIVVNCSWIKWNLLLTVRKDEVACWWSNNNTERNWYPMSTQDNWNGGTYGKTQGKRFYWFLWFAMCDTMLSKNLSKPECY